MPTSSEANGNRSFSPSPRSVNSPSALRRTNDELRKHISTLKRELEQERAKSKQTHRDKIAEIKKLRDRSDEERNRAVELAGEKYKLENEQELSKLKETLHKEKESDVKQLLKFKEEELRVTKRVLTDEKERALLEIEEKHRRYLNNRSLKEGITEQERKLRRELIEVRKQKQAIDTAYKTKSAEDAEKNDVIRRMKDDYEQNQQQAAKDNKRETSRLLGELSAAQKSIAEKELATARLESELRRLEREKITLADQLKEQSAKLELLNADSKKEKRITNEKDAIQHQKQLKELSRKNFELGMTIRRLEDKGKDLTEQVTLLRHSERKQTAIATKYETMIKNLKRAYTMERAKQLSLHAKEILDKNVQIKQLINERDASEANDEEPDKNHLQDVIQQLQKENLRLEKQLTSSPRSSASSGDDDYKMLKDRIEMISEENKMLIAKLEKYNTSSEKMANQLMLSQQENEAYAEHLSQKDKEFASLSNKLENSNSKYKALQKSHEIEEEQRNDMEKKMSAMEDEMMDIQSTLRNRSEKCRQLANEIKSLKEENGILLGKVSRLGKVEKERDNLESKITDLNRDLKRKSSEMEKLETKLGDYMHLQDELQSLEDQMSELEVTKLQSVNEIKTKEHEIDSLCKERDTQKHDYEDRLFNLQNEMKQLEATFLEVETNRHGLLEELHTLKLRESRPRENQSTQTERSVPIAHAQSRFDDHYTSEGSEVSPDSLSPHAPSGREVDMPIAAEYLQSSTVRPDSAGASTALSNSSTLATPEPMDDHDSSGLAAPTSLMIERRLSDAVVLRWTPPSRVPANDRMKGYAIYMNEQQHQVVLGAKRTNALVSDVDFTKVMSFTVRSLTSSGILSRASNKVMLSDRAGNVASNDALAGKNVDVQKEIIDGSPPRNENPFTHPYEEDSSGNEIKLPKISEPIPEEHIANQLPSTTRIEISDDLELSAIIEETVEDLKLYDKQAAIHNEPSDASEDESSDILEFIGPVSSHHSLEHDDAVNDRESDLIGGLPDLPYDHEDDHVTSTTADRSAVQDTNMADEIDEDSIESESKALQTESMSSDVKVSSLSSFQFSDDDEASDEGVNSITETSPVFPKREEQTPSTSSLIKASDIKANHKEGMGSVESAPGVAGDPKSNDGLSKKCFDNSDQASPPEKTVLIRVFIALFSYDPKTMSPNDDGGETELNFVEGDLMKIFADVDEDGFYTGELNGKRGLVPSNMVQEVNLEMIQDSVNVSHESSHHVASMDQSGGEETVHQSNGTAVGYYDIYEAEKRKMVALYDYDPHVSSPNVDAEIVNKRGLRFDIDTAKLNSRHYLFYNSLVRSELAFRAGDILYVYGEMDEDGFYAGERHGQKGLVPSNFLQERSTQPHNDVEEIEIGYQQNKKQFSTLLATSNASPHAPSPKTKRKRGILRSGKKLLAKLKGK